MLLETLGVLMSVKENENMTLPAIRFFSGVNKFSDKYGRYKANTLEGSIRLFMIKLAHKRPIPVANEPATDFKSNGKGIVKVS